MLTFVYHGEISRSVSLYFFYDNGKVFFWNPKNPKNGHLEFLKNFWTIKFFFNIFKIIFKKKKFQIIFFLYRKFFQKNWGTFISRTKIDMIIRIEYLEYWWNFETILDLNILPRSLNEGISLSLEFLTNILWTQNLTMKKKIPKFWLDKFSKIKKW